EGGALPIRGASTDAGGSIVVVIWMSSAMYHHRCNIEDVTLVRRVGTQARAGAAGVTQVSADPRPSWAPDGRARGLVGGAELVHRVVIRVCDVRVPARIKRLGDVVEQVPVRRGVDAEDAQVADVANVHGSGGDSAGCPDGLRRRGGQVQRLAGKQ